MGNQNTGVGQGQKLNILLHKVTNNVNEKPVVMSFQNSINQLRLFNFNLLTYISFKVIEM